MCDPVGLPVRPVKVTVRVICVGLLVSKVRVATPDPVVLCGVGLSLAPFRFATKVIGSAFAGADSIATLRRIAATLKSWMNCMGHFSFRLKLRQKALAVA